MCVCAAYMDYNTCMELFKSSGFLYAEPLAVGSLQDMENFPLGFKTTIPAKLGLPPLPEGISNIAEGIVVKPLKNTMFETMKGIKRAIFKRKVDGFRERKPRGPRQKLFNAHGSSDETPPDYEVMKYEMLALVTEQRVVNAISKLGAPQKKSIEGTVPSWSNIERAVLTDILAELKLDDELWEKFNKMSKHFKGMLMVEVK